MNVFHSNVGGCGWCESTLGSAMFEGDGLA